MGNDEKLNNFMKELIEILKDLEVNLRGYEESTHFYNQWEKVLNALELLGEKEYVKNLKN